MNKRITVTKENREFIAKAFGVTERMVFKALAFQSDTDPVSYTHLQTSPNVSEPSLQSVAVISFVWKMNLKRYTTMTTICASISQTEPCSKSTRKTATAMPLLMVNA